MLYVRGLLSALISSVVAAYAFGTLIEVFERSDPIINANIEKGYYYRETLNMKSSKIKFAFAALGDIDRKTRSDPRYVKWIATWDIQ